MSCLFKFIIITLYISIKRLLFSRESDLLKGYIQRLPNVICFIFLFLLLLSGTPNSAPYHGEEFQLRQPDETRVPVLIWGDEYYQDMESPQGFTLIRDPDTGWICYAELSEDGNEYVSTGLVYREGGTPPPGVFLEKHKRINKNSIRAKQQINRKAFGYNEMIEKADLMDSVSPAPSPAPPAPRVVTGLTIIVDFPDHRGTIPRPEIDNYLNQTGYTGYGCNGSVHDYFHDVSNGQLIYNNIVTQYITLPENKTYYEWGSTPRIERITEFITDALEGLNATGFDFTQVSRNEQNQVIALNLLYAGDSNTGPSAGLWPHMAAYLGDFSAGAIEFYLYQMTYMGSSLSLKTFVHESGHMLMRWPDLYSYVGQSTGVRFYCVISYPTNNPQQPNAWFRYAAGWTSVTDITSSPLGNQYFHDANSPSVYAYHGTTTGSSRELFLIEARRKTGRSTGLPGEGLLIWHIHQDGSNTDSIRPNLVGLIQADNQNHLERGIGEGDPFDPFYEGHNNRFSDNTSPAAIWHNGNSSGMDIANISPIDNRMSFTIGPNVVVNYQLTVENGTGSGFYSQGEEVSINTSIESEDGFFVRWTSETLTAASPYETATSVTMGQSDATVTPIFAVPHILPGKIEAEEFAFQQGVSQIVLDTDTKGAYFSETDQGSFAEYIVDADSPGTVFFYYQVASSSDHGKFLIRDITNNIVLDTIDVPNTGGWSSLEKVEGRSQDIPYGRALWRVEGISGDFTIYWFDIVRSSNVVVINGSGSGTYPVGSAVEIKADEPQSEHQFFSGWAGDSTSLLSLDNPSHVSALLTVPNSNVQLTATYEYPSYKGITMPSGLDNQVYVSDTMFFDNGGKYTNYSNDFSGELVLTPPEDDHRVVMHFEMLDISTSEIDNITDSLIVYSGSGEDRKLIASLKGDSIPDTIRSQSIDGAVTVRFKSNSSGRGEGWEVHITTEPIPVVSSIKKSSRIPRIFDLRLSASHSRFQLPSPEHVTIKVYDSKGRLICTLVDDFRQPGFYIAPIINRSGMPLRAGFYIVQMKAGQFNKTKRLVIMR